MLEILNPLMVDHVSIHIYSDGASRKNPGPAAVGMVFLTEKGDFIAEHRECIGICTNNEAEYGAIIRALELGSTYCRKKVNVFSDSELVINQLNGTYAIKKPNLKKLFREVKGMERYYEQVNYNHAPRTNKHIDYADKLCNQALDGEY